MTHPALQPTAVVDRLDASHLPMGLLSIAVFGPGRGEAIVVRLPNGDVGVVDGCREPADATTGQGDPVRELLEQLAPPRLAFVCLTHPHDDHYAGLGRLLAEGAWGHRVDAVWKPPYSARYARALVAWRKLVRDGGESLPDEEDVAGLERVVNAMTRLRQRDDLDFRTASAHRPLLDRDGVSIWSCGPADSDVDQAEHNLIETLERLLDGKKAANAVDPNITSSALLIRWKQAGILLGGDLLRKKAPFRGWAAAHQTITGPVQLVNVAHHASEEAHDEALWTKMAPALAIVTPFKGGKTLRRSDGTLGGNPPRPHMIDKLARAATVAITSPPEWEDEEWRMIARHGRAASASATLSSSPPVVVRTTPALHHPLVGPLTSAVAASLDADGKVQGLVLAGAADLYRAPGRAT